MHTFRFKPCEHVCGGYNSTSHYSWIVESEEPPQAIIDGEAVSLGVDGIADFNALVVRWATL
jgi:ATP-dependent DNA ligase